MSKVEFSTRQRVDQPTRLYAFNGDVAKDTEGKLRVNPQSLFRHRGLSKNNTSFLEVKQLGNLLIAKNPEVQLSREYFFDHGRNFDNTYTLEYIKLLPLSVAALLLKLIGTKAGSFLFYKQLPEAFLMPALDTQPESKIIYVNVASFWTDDKDALYINKYAYFSDKPKGTLRIGIRRKGGTFEVVKGKSSINTWLSVHYQHPAPELLPVV